MAESVYESTLAKLRQFGHESKPLARLNTGDTPGPTVLSRDPAESAIAPSFLMLRNIDEVKEVGGVPDTVFADGEVGRSAPVQPFNPATMRLRRFSPEICAAMGAYLFGDSALVRSYKDVLNALRFPMAVAVHEVQEVIVTKDHPLIISGDGYGNPIALIFKKVTVEPGGEIIWKGAGGVLSAEEMIYQQRPGEEPDHPNLVSTGLSGPDGDHGKNGTPGGNGQDGFGGVSSEGPEEDDETGGAYQFSWLGKGDCKQQATNGTNGTAGARGQDGQAGVHGGDSNEINIKCEKIEGTLRVGSGGGNGGNGGNGGDGGNGGRGGNGGAGTSKCSAGIGGNGANGGDGGDGANGGNGGKGGNVFFTYTNGSPRFTLVTATGTAGKNGVGGKVGTGGVGGTGSISGTSGKEGTTAGKNGQQGVAGTPGKIFINGKVLK